MHWLHMGKITEQYKHISLNSILSRGPGTNIMSCISRTSSFIGVHHSRPTTKINKNITCFRLQWMRSSLMLVSRDASSTFHKRYTERSKLRGSSNTTWLTQTSPFRPECWQQWPLFQHRMLMTPLLNWPGMSLKSFCPSLTSSRTRTLGLSVEGLGEHHASQLQCGPSTTGLLLNSHGQTMLLKAGIRHSGPMQVVTTSTSGGS